MDIKTIQFLWMVVAFLMVTQNGVEGALSQSIVDSCDTCKANCKVGGGTQNSCGGPDKSTGKFHCECGSAVSCESIVTKEGMITRSCKGK